jgi:hypothetical protein
MTFEYYAIYKTEEQVPPAAGLMIREASLVEDRLVIWDHLDKAWRFNPKIAVRYLMEEVHQAPEVDRSTAEQIARDLLGATLPTEEQLHEMMEEGLRTGR